MIAGIAHTHTALWYLLTHPRLSHAARTFMDDAARAGHAIGLSPISLAEILHRVEKNRLPMSAYEELKKALATAVFLHRSMAGNYKGRQKRPGSEDSAGRDTAGCAAEGNALSDIRTTMIYCDVVDGRIDQVLEKVPRLGFANSTRRILSH